MNNLHKDTGLKLRKYMFDFTGVFKCFSFVVISSPAKKGCERLKRPKQKSSTEAESALRLRVTAKTHTHTQTWPGTKQGPGTK